MASQVVTIPQLESHDISVSLVSVTKSNGISNPSFIKSHGILQTPLIAAMESQGNSRPVFIESQEISSPLFIESHGIFCFVL